MNDPVSTLKEAVLQSARFRVVAGNTKPALSSGAWHLGSLSGITAYDQQEFTITALAGTPLAELRAELSARRQHLPFDPPLRDSGASLGGTVAAGLSGAGSYRFGGISSFILGVKFINGQGEWVTGGGQVVKSAAGFDIPKLMVGSLGEFGILTEVTVKVFPRPQSRRTLLLRLADFKSALAELIRLRRLPLDLASLELIAPDTLVLQIAGSAAAARGRLARVTESLHGEVRLLDAGEAAALWTAEREFTWLPAGARLLKITCNPKVLPELEPVLQRLAGAAPRRYGLGGHVAHVAWPSNGNIMALEAALQELQLGALPLIGDWPASRLGYQPGVAFAERLRRVFDPEGKFRRRVLSEKVT